MTCSVSDRATDRDVRKENGENKPQHRPPKLTLETIDSGKDQAHEKIPLALHFVHRVYDGPSDACRRGSGTFRPRKYAAAENPHSELIPSRLCMVRR